VLVRLGCVRLVCFRFGYVRLGSVRLGYVRLVYDRLGKVMVKYVKPLGQIPAMYRSSLN